MPGTIGESMDATAWTAFLLGIFTLFAAIGALRRPGVWQTLVKQVNESPALQMISGIVEFAAGATIYLMNPWIPADLLSCVMMAIGGLMMAEALAVTGFSDLYFHFWLKNLAHMHRSWAFVSLLGGSALMLLGLFRFA